MNREFRGSDYVNVGGWLITAMLITVLSFNNPYQIPMTIILYWMNWACYTVADKNDAKARKRPYTDTCYVSGYIVKSGTEVRQHPVNAICFVPGCAVCDDIRVNHD